MYWHILHSNTCKHIPVHELEDHISEKASTSCIRIRAAMQKMKVITSPWFLFFGRAAKLIFISINEVANCKTSYDNVNLYRIY
jgi:hypothetical protein